jgi:uncharacterized protein (TIGR03437 family)
MILFRLPNRFFKSHGIAALGALRFLAASTVLWAFLNGVSALGQVTADSLIVKVPTAKWIFPANGALGTDSPLSVAANIHTDNNGDIIFADRGNDVVLRLTSDGRVHVIAGNGIAGYSGDGGQATLASLNGPNDAVVDTNGNLYINDQGNHCVRRVTPDGTISTFAFVDTDFPGSLAVDNNNNVYISHYFEISRITSDGAVSQFAGTGNYSPDPTTGCGPNESGKQALQADLFPYGMATDAAGNFYFGDACYIEKIDPSGVVSIIAGDGVAGYSPDGAALSMHLNAPIGVALDLNGNILFAEQNNDIVRRIVNGQVTTIAGENGVNGYTGDGGPPLQAELSAPNGLTVSGSGDLYIADLGNVRIREVHSNSNIITTVVGNGQFRAYPDGTPAAQVSFYGPADLAFDPQGNLLISEPPFSEIAEIDAADGSFHVAAGKGQASCNSAVFIGEPHQIAFDSRGTMYFVDPGCGSIDQRTTDGNTTIIAQGFDVGCPLGIAVDKNDNVFFSDNCNHVIHKLAPGGTPTVFAGMNGTPGYSDGPATSAQLNRPVGLAFDANGNLLVCDQGNNRVRSITPAGTVSTIAGTGAEASSGDGGPAVSAGVNAPYLIALDPSGVIFLLTSGQLSPGSLNGAQLTSGQTTLRRIDLSGIITTIAGGDGNPLINQGDGGPAGAAFLEADGVAVDPFGNLFLSSTIDDSIRAILHYEPNLYLTHGSVPELPSSAVSLTVVSHGPPSAPYSFTVDGDFAGIQFTADTGGVQWIKLANTQATTPATMAFTVDPATLGVGSAAGQIRLTRVGASAPFASLAVSVNVIPAMPPTLQVEPMTMSMSVATSSAIQQSQTLRIMNSGSDSLYFQITPSGPVADNVMLTAASGTATAATPANISVSIKPGSLQPGTYMVNLVITSCSVQPCVSGSTSGSTMNVPLAISVTTLPQSMVLSHSGLTFTGVQGGGVTPPVSFAVINGGAGKFDWTAQAIPLGNDPQWFSISPLTGTSTAYATPPSVFVTVDPSMLTAPGTYYGIVRVSSPNASNSPQDIEVVFNFLGPANSPGAVVDRSGLIFVAPAGISSPGSQLINITNLNALPLTITPSAATVDGTSWLTVVPNTPLQSIDAGGKLQLQVAARVDGLSVGVHYGTVLLQFGPDNLEVAVRMIVTPGSSASPSPASRNTSRGGAVETSSGAGCPTTLVPVLTLLSDNFTTYAGWPSALEALVTDDCGNPLNGGQVVFSAIGEESVSLVWVGNGVWQGTWFGANAGTQLTVTLTADESSPLLHGAQSYNGLLATNTQTPLISSGLPQVGPGSIVTISGSNLATASQPASQFPLLTQLEGDGVTLGGVRLPMIYTSAGSVSALVPYNFTPGPGQYALLVSRGAASTRPLPIVVGPAQPVILQILNGGPTDAAVSAIWQLITAGTAPLSTTAGNSVQAGSDITIYCTGLGGLDVMLDATQPAPSPALNVPSESQVTVTIGTTPVPAAATLAPGYAGIYVVQATVPPGIPAGDNVPLTVSAAGQSSAQSIVSVLPLF